MQAAPSLQADPSLAADPTLHQVVAQVLQSKRYRSIAPETIARLGREALSRAHGDRRDAVKRTKRHLHQIFGAFLPSRPRYSRLLDELDCALKQGSDATRAALERCLTLHASTRERLPLLGEFYQEIFAHTGVPGSVLDLACGFHPLAAPWMGLAPGARYAALEIDTQMVSFLGQALHRQGYTAKLETGDLLEQPLLPPADLAFLLKLLPTLEQQRPGYSGELLAAVPCPVLVTSFPTRSLGRKCKGMDTTYARFFEALARERGWRWERIDFRGELVYVTHK